MCKSVSEYWVKWQWLLETINSIVSFFVYDWLMSFLLVSLSLFLTPELLSRVKSFNFLLSFILIVIITGLVFFLSSSSSLYFD